MKYKTREEIVDIFTFDEFQKIKGLKDVTQQDGVFVQTRDGLEPFTKNDAVIMTFDGEVYIMDNRDVDDYFIPANTYEINCN